MSRTSKVEQKNPDTKEYSLLFSLYKIQKQVA